MGVTPSQITSALAVDLPLPLKSVATKNIEEGLEVLLRQGKAEKRGGGALYCWAESLWFPV